MSEKSIDDFWAWALSRYESKNLQKQLLKLQADADLLILEALTAAWFAQKGWRWREKDLTGLRDHTLPWVSKVIKPLRAQRFIWKESTRMKTNRTFLTELELSAEWYLARLMFEFLELNFEPHVEFGDSIIELYRENLWILLPWKQNGLESQFDRLVELFCESG